MDDKETYFPPKKTESFHSGFVVQKLKNAGQRLFLGVQSIHPGLTTAPIKGKPLLEKNVSTKANTKTKTDKNTTTKT